MAKIPFQTLLSALALLTSTRAWAGEVPVADVPGLVGAIQALVFTLLTAVFTALILPPLLMQSRDGGRVLTLGLAVPAGLVGALVAWRSGNVLLTIVAGLLTFWALRWFGF